MAELQEERESRQQHPTVGPLLKCFPSRHRPNSQRLGRNISRQTQKCPVPVPGRDRRSALLHLSSGCPHPTSGGKLIFFPSLSMNSSFFPFTFHELFFSPWLSMNYFFFPLTFHEFFSPLDFPWIISPSPPPFPNKMNFQVFSQGCCKLFQPSQLL